MLIRYMLVLLPQRRRSPPVRARHLHHLKTSWTIALINKHTAAVLRGAL